MGPDKPRRAWAIGRRGRLALARRLRAARRGRHRRRAPAGLPRARRPRPGQADHRGHDGPGERGRVRRRAAVLRRARCRQRAHRGTRRRARSWSPPASRRQPRRTAARSAPAASPRSSTSATEFCPYCVAESWPLIVALSRFGQFSGLSTSRSPYFRGHPADRRLDLLRLVLHQPLPGLRPGRDLLQRPRQAEADTRAARRAIAGCSGSRAAEQAVMTSSTRRGRPRSSISAAPPTELGTGIVPTVAGRPDLEPDRGRSPASGEHRGAAILFAASTLTSELCQLTDDRPAAACRTQIAQPGSRGSPRPIDFGPAGRCGIGSGGSWR